MKGRDWKEEIKELLVKVFAGKRIHPRHLALRGNYVN